MRREYLAIQSNVIWSSDIASKCRTNGVPGTLSFEPVRRNAAVPFRLNGGTGTGIRYVFKGTERRAAFPFYLFTCVFRMNFLRVLSFVSQFQLSAYTSAQI